MPVVSREQEHNFHSETLMACRITLAEFAQIATEECDASGWSFDVAINEEPQASPMAECLFAPPTAILHKKPIQSLVDEPEQVRPIIRNLLRWASECLRGTTR